MPEDFEIAVLRELGDIKALCVENRAKHEHNAERIQSLEKTNARQWWLHALNPLLLAATALAKKAGLI